MSVARTRLPERDVAAGRAERGNDTDQLAAFALLVKRELTANGTTGAVERHLDIGVDPVDLEDLV